LQRYWKGCKKVCGQHPGQDRLVDILFGAHVTGHILNYGRYAPPVVGLTDPHVANYQSTIENMLTNRFELEF
jgi:hypothetical protein